MFSRLTAPLVLSTKKNNNNNFFFFANHLIILWLCHSTGGRWWLLFWSWDRAGFHWAFFHAVQPSALTSILCKIRQHQHNILYNWDYSQESGLAHQSLFQRLTQELLRHLWVTKALMQWHSRTPRNLLCAGCALRKLLMGSLVGKDVSSQHQWHNLNYSLEALGGCLWSFRGPEAVPGAAAKSRVIIQALRLI